MICPSCRALNSESAEVCSECREALWAITRGTVVASRYEIEGTLGKGGMGVVYAAHDRVLDEKVALKTLRAEIGGDEEVALRFRSEIKLARKVGHRNVCRIYDYGEDRGVRFISMEYVNGIDLRQLLRRQGPLTARQAFDLAIQVLRGVEAVHEVGVVHRDLKATNIMVDPRGVVRLMDFGIARQESDATKGGLTGTGQILGTPEYMSPEQARGEKVDFRSDVYALGVVIYEIFTGQVPFKGPTPMATLFMHVQEPPPLQGAIAARIPTAVVPVLRRALAKDPSERFGSTQDMLAALLAARATELPDAPGFEAEPVTTPTVVPARARRRRTSISAWFVAGFVALAAGVVFVRDDMLSALLPSASSPPVPAAVRGPSPGATPPPTPAPGPSVADSPDSSAAARSTEWTEPLSLPALPPAAAPATPGPTTPGNVGAEAPHPTEAPPLLSPAVETRGILRLTVVPFADVTVDDADAGRIVSRQMALSPGSHVLVFGHPDFEPLRRTVDLAAGEAVDLRVDLSQEATPRKPPKK